MVTRRRLGGFTLIELLIAMAILALVIGLSTFAFSLYSRHWDGLRSDFERKSGQMQRIELVARALRDALPWVVRDEAGRPGFYFLGREEGVTLVTASPVYAAYGPAVIRLFREREASGSWRLVYEEAPLAGMVLREGSQTLPFKHRMLVVERVSLIAFKYFGWATWQQSLGDDMGGQLVAPQWWGEFDGLVRQQQPLRLAFSLGEFETSFPMPDRASVTFGRAVPLM